jgi:hypothetical protein
MEIVLYFYLTISISICSWWPCIGSVECEINWIENWIVACSNIKKHDCVVEYCIINILWSIVVWPKPKIRHYWCCIVELDSLCKSKQHRHDFNTKSHVNLQYAGSIIRLLQEGQIALDKWVLHRGWSSELVAIVAFYCALGWQLTHSGLPWR